MPEKPCATGLFSFGWVHGKSFPPILWAQMASYVGFPLLSSSGWVHNKTAAGCLVGNRFILGASIFLPLSAFSRPTCSCIRIEKRNLKLCFHRMCGILVLFSIINFGGVLVAICYKKLWKLLIDRDMQKKDLRIAAGLSTNVIAKLGKNQNVSTEVLGKICKVLNCEITDIMEFIDEEPEKEKNNA